MVACVGFVLNEVGTLVEDHPPVRISGGWGRKSERERERECVSVIVRERESERERKRGRGRRREVHLVRWSVVIVDHCNVVFSATTTSAATLPPVEIVRYRNYCPNDIG